MMIRPNGQPVGSVFVTRTDGRDGDAAFNPYGLPDGDQTDRSYSITLPRITSSTNISVVARADGSAANMLLKLDGGIDLNSQMEFITQTTGTRDNPPTTAKDKFLGYEQMRYVRRIAEKFAAIEVSRNVIGSVGAETYICTVGAPGFSMNNGSGINTSAGTAQWVYHSPTNMQYNGTTPQFAPLPESAAGQPIEIFFKVGNTGETDNAYIYYTLDGSNPEGSGGVGKGNTAIIKMSWHANDGDAAWHKGIVPAQSGGTQIKYKIAAYNSNAPDRFPWSDDDLDLLPRMETMFEITNFNASTVLYYPHNDWGETYHGLDEGFHVLRMKAFLGRAGGDTAIYRENTQTFYYDAATPEARFVFPKDNGITLDESSYRVVVRSDMTVEEVWYKIEDMDPGNDDSTNGLANGNGAWVQAEKGINGALEAGKAPEQQWEFDYVSIPTNGSATISVVLRELTS